MKLVRTALLIFVSIILSSCAGMPRKANLPVPEEVRAYSRQFRVDLYWGEGDLWRTDKQLYYEVQRADEKKGPFKTINDELIKIPAYSDFIGKEDQARYYRVRMVKHTYKEAEKKVERTGGEELSVTVVKEAEPGKLVAVSPWSEVVSAKATPYDEAAFLTELQEAGFRYFWEMAHPVSGLSRENLPGWDRNLCSIGSTGFSMFNYIVGVERGFITRKQAAERVLKATDFLLNDVDRFFGIYPHWVNGETGKVIPFEVGNDGSDMVETSFLVMGLFAAREYFDGTVATEQKIRIKVNKVWESIDWISHATTRPDGTKALYWIWSPTKKEFMNLYCQGFSECQMLYLLAMSSPTHAVSDDFYWEGWEQQGFYEKYTMHGVELDFPWTYRIPLFPAHYSYMGLDPNKIKFKGKPYYDILKNWCLAQYRYFPTRKDDFKGYEHPLWGLTASINPSGYKAHAPGDAWEHSVNLDDGTVAPTAALSSMPYLPAESKAAMTEMFTKYGDRLWGPFGFYDAFNLTVDWFPKEYLSIDVGPIAPMIENHRTGKCWDVFMQAPEIQKTIKRIHRTEPEASRQ
jgi:hypothetical protein